MYAISALDQVSFQLEIVKICSSLLFVFKDLPAPDLTTTPKETGRDIETLRKGLPSLPQKQPVAGIEEEPLKTFPDYVELLEKEYQKICDEVFNKSSEIVSQREQITEYVDYVEQLKVGRDGLQAEIAVLHQKLVRADESDDDDRADHTQAALVSVLKQKVQELEERFELQREELKKAHEERDKQVIVVNDLMDDISALRSEVEKSKKVSINCGKLAFQRFLSMKIFGGVTYLPRNHALHATHSKCPSL